MTSYYVFSALAAQRENEIERMAAEERHRQARRRASAPKPPQLRHRRLDWRRRRHLRLV
jgi:hypothetical protein